jgi:hypothetical protein
VDTVLLGRENERVIGAGASRQRITRTLGAAYAGGLISHDTYLARLDELLGSQVVDPKRLVGDLSFRARPRPRRLTARLRRALSRRESESPVLLALDWAGGEQELLIGRHMDCDVRVVEPTVSRHHARLVFRDGKWILLDLESTNGSWVNGTPVRRCELRPGDRLRLGDALLRID